MKRTQLNVALALAAVALGTALWLSREQTEPKPPLTPLAEDALRTIEIAHPDRPVIRLEKRGDDWRLTAPVDAPVDAFELSSLTGLAEREVQRSLPLAEVQLAELKLDPPAYTITLNDVTLGFGDTEPIEFRRYVRVGDEVRLIADPPSAALDADYSDLVAKELLPAAAQLQRIEVPGLVVQRAADGSWTADGHADAGADQLQGFVSAWRGARAMWNALRPEDAGDDSGEPVRLVLQDGSEVRLRVVEREPQLKIDRADYGIRYTLSKADADKLLKLPEPSPAPTSTPTPSPTPLP